MVRYHKKDNFEISTFLGLTIITNIKFTLLYTLFCVMILQLQLHSQQNASSYTVIFVCENNPKNAKILSWHESIFKLI